MIRVLLLSRYGRTGSSSRLRFLQYTQELEARGIAVEPAPFFDDRYLSRRYAGFGPRPDHIAQYYVRRLRELGSARRYDLIWLEKEALPWLPAWAEQLCLGRTPYVLDLDDAWFHRYGLHHFSMVRSLLGDKLETLARRAAAVVVGNDYLEAWAQAAGAREVVQIPTTVDVDRYPQTPPPKQNGSFTIGWIGQPSTVAYVHDIAGALRQVCEHSAAYVRLVGVEGPGLPGVPLECRPWTEASEVGEIASFDVGIAPLRDGPWERGKCGYKILQYMAAGRPVVASRVGANASLVREGETGLLVETEHEWIQALTRLRRDPPLRSRMGQAGRLRVEKHYSLEANTYRILKTLHEAK